MRKLLVPIVLASCAADPGGGEHLGEAQQANVCATGTTLEGVDVSTYDQTVSWPDLKASGRSFGIAKATEGTTVTDDQFKTNWAGMKSAGIVRSAYHFFHCDVDPTAQASFFLGVMGALEAGDLPPSLDFEDTTTCTPAQGVAMAVTWLDAVASATGTLPLLYTSVNVLSNFDNTEQFTGHAQLWVASRGVGCPNLPAPFTAWSFWQYSLTGTAPGLPSSDGMADLDQFNGDMTALLAITLGGSATTGASTSSSGGPPTCTAGGVAGTCIDTSVCASMPGYVSTAGLCPGPATEECCTPTGTNAASVGSASGSSSSASSSGHASASASSGTGGDSAATGTPSASSSCAVSLLPTSDRDGAEARASMWSALAIVAAMARRLRA